MRNALILCIKTLCWQNAEFVDVKADGAYSNCRALNRHGFLAIVLHSDYGPE